MVWAWMLWSPYALGTQTEVWFGHGCSGHRMLLEHERNYGLGMDALGHRMLLEHERNYGLGMDALGHRMLLEHERNYGLGMDALVTVCSWNTNGIMVWAWMLWSPYALGTRTLLWFGHGFSGERRPLEHEGKSNSELTGAKTASSGACTRQKSKTHKTQLRQNDKINKAKKNCPKRFSRSVGTNVKKREDKMLPKLGFRAHARDKNPKPTRPGWEKQQDKKSEKNVRATSRRNMGANVKKR